MKSFKVDQHELGFYDSADRDIDYLREAARAVLKNQDGHIAVMHFTATGSYKLPGGGIDEGEESIVALEREIREETGYTIKNIQELCTYDETRYVNGMHQISYCYTAAVDTFVGTELTEKETAQGMNLQWANNYDEAIAWIQSGTELDEDGSKVGLEMMKLRDTTILKYAQDPTYKM